MKLRRKNKVGIGSGGEQALEQAIRVHANAIEYIPMALLLIAFFELNGGSIYLVHLFGAVLVVARLLHAQGLSSTIGKSKGRYFGALFTFLVILFCSLANLWLVLAGLF